MNKSRPFLFPLSGMQHSSVLDPSFIDSYLSDGSAEMGKKYYLLYNNQISQELKEKLEASPKYSRSYTTASGDLMYEFTVTPTEYDTVVTPFMEGKYSQVDKTWVDENYSFRDTTSNIRMVFDKHPSVRSYWEEEKGLELPEEAEVWSRPTLSDETYLNIVYV